MTSLHKTQTAFKDMMINHNFDQPEKTFQTGGVSLDKRMGAYKNNYSAGLSDVLSGTFQTVTALVGEEFMTAMCQRYIRQHPPQKACMHDYGETLPDFIESFEPAKSLGYLPDIARLDWAANTAYHADNLEAVTPENLQELSIETDGFRFSFHPSVSILSSQFPIHDIRHYVRDEERQKQKNLEIIEEGTLLLVSRQNGQVYIQELSPAEYSFLQNPKPLMEAVEETLEKFTGFDFQTLLHKTLICETFLFIETNRP